MWRVQPATTHVFPLYSASSTLRALFNNLVAAIFETTTMSSRGT